MSKTNTGLVAYAKAQLGKPYWYGCFGQTSTKALYEAKKKQYPSYYTWSCPADQLGKRVHDCVGLIKGYLWSDSTTATPKYNAAQDVSANGMYEKCTKKGSIDTMPDVPGVLVFLPGHVGVYIGGGQVIEAKGHAYGVVPTALKDRDWKTWGYCPWIEYTTTSTAKTTTSTSTSATKTATKTKAPTYKVGGTYTLKVDGLAVRTGAGTSYRQKKRSELTVNAKLHAKAGSMASLKTGTRVTVKEVKTVGSDVWLRIPSGWIAGYYNGKVYVG
ncbi:MAG: C40 family peptidase [Eubacterium sp.]|nr:C40 family peptidase [Eubacterium sp.]